MGIFAPSLNETFDFVCEQDTALDMQPEEYESYISSGCDPALLKLKEGQQPTRFQMRKTLKYEDSLFIQSLKLQFDSKGKPKSNSSFMIEEVRFLLVGIKNPPDVPEDQQLKFKRDKDHKANSSIMESLLALGAVDSMYLAYLAQNKSKNPEADKKK